MVMSPPATIRAIHVAGPAHLNAWVLDRLIPAGPVAARLRRSPAAIGEDRLAHEPDSRVELARQGFFLRLNYLIYLVFQLVDRFLLLINGFLLFLQSIFNRPLWRSPDSAATDIPTRRANASITMPEKEIILFITPPCIECG